MCSWDRRLLRAVAAAIALLVTDTLLGSTRTGSVTAMFGSVALLVAHNRVSRVKQFSKVHNFEICRDPPTITSHSSGNRAAEMRLFFA